jgi:hypothetical protein
MTLSFGVGFANLTDELDLESFEVYGSTRDILKPAKQQ